MATFEGAALEAQMECSKAITILSAFSDELAPNMHAHILLAGILDYVASTLRDVPLSLALQALNHANHAVNMLAPFEDTMGLELKRLYDEERKHYRTQPPW